MPVSARNARRVLQHVLVLIGGFLAKVSDLISGAHFPWDVLWGCLTIGLLGLVERQPGAIVVFLSLNRQVFDGPRLPLDRRVEVAGLGIGGGERIETA